MQLTAEEFIASIPTFQELEELKPLIKKRRTAIRKEMAMDFRDNARAGDRVRVNGYARWHIGREGTLMHLPRNLREHCVVALDAYAQHGNRNSWTFPAWALEKI